MQTVEKFGFEDSLIELEINACLLNEVTAHGQENIFTVLNNFIMRFPNLEKITLIGLGIVDHIGDLVQACKRPKLKSLNLPLNGIEPEYCSYFQYLLNFETL